MLDGKMFAGLASGDLMLRLGPDYEAALTEPHVREMDFTGRPMRGYVYVAPAGFATDEELRRWLERAMTFVATVPAAPKRKRSAR
jgi:hypothetical protein